MNHDCRFSGCRLHPFDGVLHVLSRPYPPGDPKAKVMTTSDSRGNEAWFESQLTNFPEVT